MPNFNDRPLAESKSPSSFFASSSSVGGLIQSPELNSKAEPTQHAIRDVSQAREVVKTVQQAGRNRSTTNARIQAKLNSERPYDQGALEREGLSWRSNFSSRTLPQIVEKVFPRFVQAVQGLKHLTNSSLSEKWANSTEKTELFRSAVTDCIRGRKGWVELLENISFTNAVYGSAVVGFLDELQWFPKAFQQDESYLTDGCKQSTASAQVVVLKELYLPHELFEMIKNREAAETVGWNIKNTIAAINEASPSQLRDTLGNGGTTESFYNNAIRELNLGTSYMAGASVIAVYNLLAVEVGGKVSHYRLAGDKLDEIFSKDDRFESPEDCLAFFSYERGNGTMHGSRGIGRQAYELAGMLERSKNELVDRAIMSGKILVQGDVKRLHTYRMSVIGATCVIPNGWTVLTQNIDGNVQPFLQLDAFFSQLVDQIVGSVSPPQIGGQGEAFRSSASWQLLAAREEEGKDARLVRFLEQFVSLVQTMQRRICRKGIIDDDAKAVQKALLEKMTRAELDELANMPVAGTIQDLTLQERQMIVALAQEKRGNPLYNARQLEIEDLTARMDTQFADRVLLPVEDPTEEAEQTRQQMLEITLLALGQPVPVSPRDNHLLHLKVLIPTAEQLAGQIQAGTSETAGLEALLGHITEHYNAAVAAGVDKEALKDAAELVKNAGKALAQLKQLDQEAQQLQQQSAEQDALPEETPV